MVVSPNILALDVGTRRVGIAMASAAARLPQPLTTLQRDDSFFEKLKALIESENIGQLVIGLPRSLSGDATGQTKATQTFVAELKRQFDVPVQLQDEAVTSKQAEKELQSRGRTYRREDIDALAATYILEDFLNEG